MLLADSAAPFVSVAIGGEVLQVGLVQMWGRHA